MSRYDQPYSGAFYSTNPPNPPAPPAVPGEKRRSGLGAAALVLALLAMLFGWVPILGLVMIPPALLAILLGVVGFVAAVVTGRTGKALPFIASVIGVFALLVPPCSPLRPRTVISMIQPGNTCQYHPPRQVARFHRSGRKSRKPAGRDRSSSQRFA